MSIVEVIDNIDKDIFNIKVKELTGIDKNYFNFTFKKISVEFQKVNDCYKYLLEDNLSYEELEVKRNT